MKRQIYEQAQKYGQLLYTSGVTIIRGVPNRKLVEKEPDNKSNGKSNKLQQ